MKQLFALFLLASLSTMVLGQEKTQTIRGSIIDKDSEYPIIGVNVIVLGSNPVIGGTTDVNGYFSIKNVPIGRHSLKASFIGYEDVYLNNVLVVSGKELNLNLEMTESLVALKEIVITANDDKTVLNNDMATVSARSFDLEETSRYAGSRNDPARMASNFAGVATANDGRNDIIIRGNSPSGLLYRLEGLDIPNPSHFGSIGATGGPVTILNNNQLAKSDFLTAAFPAEYGNALAGVFDLRLRNGNSSKSEYTGQVGFNGFEFGAEGPFSKESNASYMFNYRYSTLGAVDALGVDFGTGAAVPNYQDLSFKINVPTNKGAFSLFGIGGISDIDLLGSELDLDDENTDQFGNENEDIYADYKLGIVGFSYTHFIDENTYAKFTTGASTTNETVKIDSISNDRSQIVRFEDIAYRQSRYTTHALINKKINAKNTVTAGVILDLFDFDFDHEILINGIFIPNRALDGTSLLARGYGQWQHRFNEKLTFNGGLHFQHFELSGSNAFEPRAGIKYQFRPNQSISLGYGLHHQLQLIPLYFQQDVLEDGTVLNTNEDLDFTRSHHFALAYDRNFNADFRFKAELYYQNISNAAVDSQPTSFSALNTGADFEIPDNNYLVNEGEARNYGIELTLEKFFSRQYYFLVTSSLFDSEYKGSDNIWRNSAFNGNYVVNLLAGKEWKVGSGDNTLALDWKLTTAGGRYYTPVDLAASAQAGFQVLQDSEAFTERFNDYFRTDVKISYRMNRPKVTHEFGLDIQNVTNRENDFSRTYNRRTNEVVTETQLGLFPVPQYRLLF